MTCLLYTSNLAFTVDDFSRKLHVPQQPRVPVILQRPFADAKPPAHLITCLLYTSIIGYIPYHGFME